MTQQQKQILIPAAFAQELCEYLQTRPYKEVADLIQRLIRSPFASIVPAPTPEEKKPE